TFYMQETSPKDRKYHALKQQCLKAGTLFKDEEFPACPSGTMQTWVQKPHVYPDRPQGTPGAIDHQKSG
uniref:Uncharacterized protein n=1 Tax=Accipiter nisus TaxID=211598 RepID=A0A8B9N2Z3_9AVES